MEDNSGATPNPLNPNPTEPTGLVSEPDTMPVAEKITTTEPVTTEAEVESTTLDPTNRPMQKAPMPEVEVKPVKKNKTGLLVGALVCLFLAIGCGVAATLLFLNQSSSEDAVALAINKLMTGNTPKNLVVSGDINIDIKDNSVPFSNIKVGLNSETINGSMINSTKISVDANIRGGSDKIDIDFSEVYATNGDLYLKLEGVTNAIEDLSTRESLLSDLNVEDKCIDDETGDNKCLTELDDIVDCEGNEDCVDLDLIEEPSSEIVEYLSMFSGIVEAIDGEWIRIANDDLDGFGTTTDQTALSCAVDFINNMHNSSNSFVHFYQENPFIVSKSKNLPVQSKQNPIYEITIDIQNLDRFIRVSNDIRPVTEELFNCMGYEDDEVNIDNLVEELGELPNIYVEVDGNYDFTRLYFTKEIEIGTITVDLGLSYPMNVNISEPSEYQDLTTLLQGLYEDGTVIEETTIEEQSI